MRTFLAEMGACELFGNGRHTVSLAGARARHRDSSASADRDPVAAGAEGDVTRNLRRDLPQSGA
eukprot:1790358-Pleurochrysis_carterae.AAC.1